MKTTAGCVGLSMRFGIMFYILLLLSTHACCDNQLAEREKGKIPGREGNLVKRICNLRICTHAQTSLHSMHMAAGMNACSCAVVRAYTRTHDCIRLTDSSTQEVAKFNYFQISSDTYMTRRLTFTQTSTHFFTA